MFSNYNFRNTLIVGYSIVELLTMNVGNNIYIGLNGARLSQVRKEGAYSAYFLKHGMLSGCGPAEACRSLLASNVIKPQNLGPIPVYDYPREVTRA